MIINLDKLFYRIIFTFPLTTLFQSYFEGINKVIFGLLIFLLLLKYRKVRKSIILVVIILSIVYVFTIYKTGTIPYNINELFYFPFAILYLIYMGNHIRQVQDYLALDKKYIKNIICIWTILVIISFFIPSSYTIEWGEARYFGSYCQSIWRLAPTCIFILTFSIIGITFYKERKYIIFSVVPFICLLAGGSRTYMLVGIILLIIAWYYYLDSKTKWYLSIIPFLTILVLIILNSSMVDKIAATTFSANSYFDFWGTLTSGRSIFWEADINSFFQSNFINKLVGQGFNAIYEINWQAFGGKVWAHNDFIQCLISHGILGLGIYLYSIVSLYTIVWKRKKDFFPKFAIILVWFVNAMFNMFYTYFCSILSFPFLIIAVYQKDIDALKNQKN